MKLCLLHSPPNTDGTGIGNYQKWAHHPDCYRYDHHLVRFRNTSLCLGCLGLWTGFILSFLLLFQNLWLSLNLWHNFLVGLILLIPTILQPYLQKRLFKFPSRFLLGCAIWIVIVGTIMKNNWMSLEGGGYALVIGLSFMKLKKWILNYRNQNTKVPCTNCPHGKYPLCSHYIDDIQKAADSENAAEGMREFYLTLIKQLKSENPNDGNLVEIESFNIKGGK